MEIEIKIQVKYDPTSNKGTDVVKMLRRSVDSWIARGGLTRSTSLVVDDLGTSIQECV